MKYYIIAGEASGDLHASNLIKELKQLDSNAIFRCWGGDLMEEQGATVVKHYKDLAFMGFVEVLLNLRTILSNIAFCKKDIMAFQPDVLILVDYPGFNLRIAKYAKQQGLKVFYYISPSVWAWHESRVEQVRRFVDKMFVILPFEKEFYAKHHIEVEYAGHPLTDVVNDWKMKHVKNEEWIKQNALTSLPIIAIIPGSRKQEISRMLPIMIEAALPYQQHQLVITGAPSIPKEFYILFLAGLDIKILFNQTYTILQHADAAIVKSGTSTLEAALMQVPQVVCYKANPISYRIAKMLTNIKFISLVNLIMDREIVKELIQHDMTVINIRKELTQITYNKLRRREIANDYNDLIALLGTNGASRNIAAKMWAYLRP